MGNPSFSTTRNWYIRARELLDFSTVGSLSQQKSEEDWAALLNAAQISILLIFRENQWIDIFPLLFWGTRVNRTRVNLRRYQSAHSICHVTMTTLVSIGPPEETPTRGEDAGRFCDHAFEPGLSFLEPISHPPLKNLLAFYLRVRKKVWMLMGSELRRINLLHDKFRPFSKVHPSRLPFVRRTRSLSGSGASSGIHQHCWWRHWEHHIRNFPKFHVFPHFCHFENNFENGHNEFSRYIYSYPQMHW